MLLLLQCEHKTSAIIIMRMHALHNVWSFLYLVLCGLAQTYFLEREKENERRGEEKTKTACSLMASVVNGHVAFLWTDVVLKSGHTC